MLSPYSRGLRAARRSLRSHAIALASVLTLSGGIGGVTFIAGCGGGGSSNPSPSPSATYDRSYSATSVSLPGTGLASIGLSVANDLQHIVGTLTLTPSASSESKEKTATRAVTRQTSVVVTLSGTLTNASTGAFTVSGSYTDPTSGATIPVTVTGTLPVPPATTGGSFTITIGITIYNTSFGNAPITVMVSPATAALSIGDSQQFTATVAGTNNTSVMWSVAESGGGTVNAMSGLYTAPATRGTYHVVAVSQADGVTSGTATVTVQSANATGTIKSARANGEIK